MHRSFISRPVVMNPKATLLACRAPRQTQITIIHVAGSGAPAPQAAGNAAPVNTVPGHARLVPLAKHAVLEEEGGQHDGAEEHDADGGANDLLGPIVDGVHLGGAPWQGSAAEAVHALHVVGC